MPRQITDHTFSVAPQLQAQRSVFNRPSRHSTTFNAGYLIPIYIDEVLPGDTISMNLHAFARMGSPLKFPLMDNLFLDNHWFFIPARQLWDNFRKFMGEQINPGDSISYTVPTVASPVTGYTEASIFDYMGLPTKVTSVFNHSALPLRCYPKVWDEWFRDENLQNSQFPTIGTGDGPDLYSNI